MQQKCSQRRSRQTLINPSADLMSRKKKALLNSSVRGAFEVEELRRRGVCAGVCVRFTSE